MAFAERLPRLASAVRTLASFALLASSACGAPETSQPNLLLIVVDTLRADHVSPYGYRADVTPRLSQLAEEGARVETAYSPTATTGPTHAGLFTGRFPRSVGVLRNAVSLADAHLTLAERLLAAGWGTAAIVSSFPLHRKFGFAQGFEAYDDAFDPKRATVKHASFEGHDVPEGFDRRADETTDHALTWLAKRKSAPGPFFLFVHYFDPHEPYAAPMNYQRRFAAVQGATLREQAAALYDAEVAFADAEIGRLLDGLSAIGLADDTLVVLTADHGEGLFSHGHLFHDVHLYEEAVRVPLFLRGAGIPAGHVIAGPVSLLDLVPTLLEWLGVDASAETLPGASLVDALRGGAGPARERSVLLERREFTSERVGTIPVKGEKLAVRRGPWKYIEAAAEERFELYDLSKDPTERKNVRSEEPIVAQELAAELQAWRAQTPRAEAAGSVSPEDRKRLEALGYID